MTIKDLLLLLDAQPAAEARVEATMALADRFGARVMALHLVPEPYMPGIVGHHMPEEVLKEHAGNPEAWGRQAQLLALNGRLEEAEQALQKAFDLNPNYPFGLVLRGQFRQQEGELIGALLLFRKAAEAYAPDAAEQLAYIHELIGDIELRLNRPVAAQAAIRRAAHYLPSAAPGHPNSRMHGHSFRARVSIDGKPDPKTGLLLHFDDIESVIAEARDALDHRLLNEVEGLDSPTLERIAMWLWDRLHNRLPGLAEIEIARDSCHEGCIYAGPRDQRLRAAE